MEYIIVPKDMVQSEIYPKYNSVLSNVDLPPTPLTGWEALIDLVLTLHPTGEGKLSELLPELLKRWAWTEESFRTWVKLNVSVVEIDEESIFLQEPQKWYPEFKLPESTYSLLAQSVINLFNEIFGRNISLVASRRRMIVARIKEGASLPIPIKIPQFKAVFEFKKKEWENDPKMSKYLEIETLCAASHFHKYLDQAREDFKKSKQYGGSKKMFYVYVNSIKGWIWVDEQYREPGTTDYVLAYKNESPEMAKRYAEDLATQKGYKVHSQI